MKKIYKIITILFLCIGLFTSCSKSGCKSRNEHRKTERKEHRQKRSRISRRNSANKVVIQMRKEGGVYNIPVEINGSKMEFIFDTGASIISISATEARFLMKQGTLTKNDFIRKSKFTDANGDVSVGMIVNLKTVKLGGVILENVEASIVNNAVAPLLLGQSALAKFGKISIDYNKNRLILEQ